MPQVSRLLNTYIEKRFTGYVQDADIKSFLNNLDYEWAVKFIESKIKDPNIIRFARREGWGYGRLPVFGYRSQFRARLCLFVNHCEYSHALCAGVVVQGKDTAKGFCILVMYADDFVACFQYKWEAEQFYEQLKKRMGILCKEEVQRDVGIYTGKLLYADGHAHQKAE